MYFLFQFLTKNEQINIEIMGVAFTCQDYHAIGTTFWLGNWFTFWFFLITDKLTQRLLVCLIYLAILFFSFFSLFEQINIETGLVCQNYLAISSFDFFMFSWLFIASFFRIWFIASLWSVLLELLWWWWQTKGDDVDDYGGGNDGNVTNVERPMVGCPLLIPFPPRR